MQIKGFYQFETIINVLISSFRLNTYAMCTIATSEQENKLVNIYNGFFRKPSLIQPWEIT